ncbi:hypothetical protein SCB49_01077 [unidentified eubacterium SCB49]|nr:hypothetical protein SCB49_01077 [unidentified eubacterium SCB49]
MRLYKTLGSALLTLFLLASCGPSENEMTLTGNVKGLKKGTLLLQKIEDTVLVTLDSVKILGDSQFSFSETVESPEIYFLYVRLDNGVLLDTRLPFFAEAAPINIETTLKSFALDAVITGSTNQKLLEQYQAITRRFTDKNLEYIEQGLNALENQDSIMDALDKKRIRLMQSNYLAAVNYALQHNDNEIAPYIMISQPHEGNIKYLDTVYNTLTKRVKESNYGKQLNEIITLRKEK